MGKTTPKGFEPLRAEPNGFLVHHLNHSVTVSLAFKEKGIAGLRFSLEAFVSIVAGAPVQTAGFRSHGLFIK